MGCVQGKPSPTNNRRQSRGGSLHKLKIDNGYVIGGNEGKPIAARKPFVETSVKENSGKKNNHVGDGVNNGNIGKEGGGENDRKISREGIGNVSQRIGVGKKIGSDELIDGWPKWLVDNIPKDVLANLVSKTADSYDKLAKIGHGTYSNVYKARDRDTGKIVALKKVRFDTSEPESVKFMAREIIILQKLDHPNIIKLEGLATSRMQYSLYLVFDYMQSDLTRVISRPEGRLTEPQVKCYMQQLLSGLEHCHERGILHRDIKGSNLLIDQNGMLKIADFGLANYYQPKQKRPLTSRVVTLWYRAPELLLGTTDYGVGIDLWSTGCLLAEMFVGRPIMPGRTEVEQLHRIFKLCGSPPEDYWKKIKPPTTFRPPQNYVPSFREAFTNFPSSSFGLLTTLLALDPASRGTSASALQNDFFSSSPLACELSGLPLTNKEEEEPIQFYDRNTNRTMKTKQKTRKSRKGHNRNISVSELSTENSGSSREQEKHVDKNSVSQETGRSTSSNTSSKRTNTTIEHSPPFTLAFHSNPPDNNRSARTEAHPNALKNIKNFPLLLASITQTVNHMEENRNGLNRRSMSNVDFRHLDIEKISKLFGLDEH
ncbi:probable serine/threonine-protein kinase At1g54610 [Cynara cardunculus var. scolymus]|uniref:probable serine/threonine-protein kinase At1g54610 n=1 Tax=Cynara cardunculus var. scolymus TaxID=59895 RepID=UPI000D62434D|nr:probable serine/threonine-protein kinase At1g54610 [Cynara cardunculus var. scolymus]